MPSGAVTTTNLYVSPTGSAGAGDTSCANAGYSIIDAAINAAPTNAFVIVCTGTYKQAVVLDRPVHLKGVGATLDASGHQIGIDLTASGATVVNFLVENATGEGILARGAAGRPIARITISNNLLRGNDRGEKLASYGNYKECQPGPHKAPGDCGAAIHIQFATNCLVSGNVISGNPGGGILLSDEFGPTYDNTVEANVVTGNAYGGITLASRNIRSFNGGTHPGLGGIYKNQVVNNDVIGNGANGRGGGILLASSVRGGAVYDNTVINNKISGNGLPGVAVHSRARGQDLDGNVITLNQLGSNNSLGDRAFAPHDDLKSTAVLIGSSYSAISITVSHNPIQQNVVGIWTTGPVSLSGTQTNAFKAIPTHLQKT